MFLYSVADLEVAGGGGQLFFIFTQLLNYHVAYDAELFPNPYVPVTVFPLAPGFAAMEILTDPFALVVIGPDDATGTTLGSFCESTSHFVNITLYICFL